MKLELVALLSNPGLPLTLFSIGSLIELMGVGEGNETDIMARTNLTTFPRKLYVPPNHYVVYR